MSQEGNSKYTGFIYGEGGLDKHFIIRLIDLPNFRYHTKRWAPFQYGNASGGDVEEILKRCYQEVSGMDYGLVLCIVDLERFKKRHGSRWAIIKGEIEAKYKVLGIEVFWQYDDAEDEYRRVLNTNLASKTKLNKLARENVAKFINSGYWKRLLTIIKKREEELDKVATTKIL